MGQCTIAVAECTILNWKKRRTLQIKTKKLLFFFWYNCLGYLDRGLHQESFVKLYLALILFHSEEMIWNSMTTYSPLATVLSFQALNHCQHYLYPQSLQTSLSFSLLIEQVSNLVAANCVTPFPVGSEAWRWNLGWKCHTESFKSSPTYSIAK